MPKINKEKCNRCDACLKICPTDGAIEDYGVTDSCSLCSLCLDVCESGAISASFRDPINLTRIISDNALEVLNCVKKAGFINLAIDILPHCDCHPFSDIPMVPDIGVFAALDHGSSADDALALDPGVDKFDAVNPGTSWRSQLNRAEELGIGSQKYEITVVK
jgi:uncharacterized Fe-S center protein